MFNTILDKVLEGKNDLHDDMALLAKAYMLGMIETLLSLQKLLEDAPRVSTEELREAIALSLNNVMELYQELHACTSEFDILFDALNAVIKDEKR